MLYRLVEKIEPSSSIQRRGYGSLIGIDNLLIGAMPLPIRTILNLWLCLVVLGCVSERIIDHARVPVLVRFMSSRRVL